MSPKEIRAYTALRDEARRAEITSLHDAATTANATFEAACLKHYSNGKWGFYRAIEEQRNPIGDNVRQPPAELIALSDAAIAALHAFYAARDGAEGFLGSRGL